MFLERPFDAAGKGGLRPPLQQPPVPLHVKGAEPFPCGLKAVCKIVSRVKAKHHQVWLQGQPTQAQHPQCLQGAAAGNTPVDHRYFPERTVRAQQGFRNFGDAVLRGDGKPLKKGVAEHEHTKLPRLLHAMFHIAESLGGDPVFHNFFTPLQEGYFPRHDAAWTGQKQICLVGRIKVPGLRQDGKNKPGSNLRHGDTNTDRNRKQQSVQQRGGFCHGGRRNAETNHKAGGGAEKGDESRHPPEHGRTDTNTGRQQKRPADNGRGARNHSAFRSFPKNAPPQQNHTRQSHERNRAQHERQEGGAQQQHPFRKHKKNHKGNSKHKPFGKGVHSPQSRLCASAPATRHARPAAGAWLIIPPNASVFQPALFQ